VSGDDSEPSPRAGASRGCSYLSLHRYAAGLGLKLLLRGRTAQGRRYLLGPMNYWRTLEYRLVCREADVRAGERVLDLASPKLLSLFLADKIGAEVFATDISGSSFLKEYALLRTLAGVPAERFRMQREDGRALSFPDAFFHKIYSISVLEHIPEGGDSVCMHELGRVLIPGGRVVVTVPFSPRSREEYARPAAFHWSPFSTPAPEEGVSASTTSRGGVPEKLVFYQRRYSEADLKARLIRPSGLRVRKLAYAGERIMKRSEREFVDVLPSLRLPRSLEPLLSKIFHTRVVDHWSHLEKPLLALLVLEKPAQSAPPVHEEVQDVKLGEDTDQPSSAADEHGGTASP
jgi:SAM-dependent methyltransferase